MANCTRSRALPLAVHIIRRLEKDVIRAPVLSQSASRAFAVGNGRSTFPTTSRSPIKYCCRRFATGSGSDQDSANGKDNSTEDLGHTSDDGDDDDDGGDDDDDDDAYNNDRVSASDDTKDNIQSNPGLESVIKQGIDFLKDTSSLIQNRKETKKPLFHKSAMGDEDAGPNKQQLAEANRILTVAARCLETLDSRHKHSRHNLSVMGYPILILHVEVNSNLREATLFWALPFEILLEADETTRLRLTEQMQDKIDNQGGGSFLQREVHRVLSAYYPPKLKFKPASNVLLQQLMEL